MSNHIFLLRIKAILIDILTITLIYFLFDVILDFIDPTKELIFNDISTQTNVLIIILNFVFLIKDINGASFGKKIMGLKIVDCKHFELKPTPLKLIFRNVFLWLGVIEIIIFIVYKKRLGDILTNTCVIKR